MNTTAEQSTMTEAEFLDAQAADAQAALHKTWTELKGTLRETASLKVWAQRHPWAVTGAALAGGFMLATMLASPPEPAEVKARPEAEPNGQERESAPRRQRLAWLLGPLFGLLKPLLGQLISSVIGAAMAPTAEPTSEDLSAANGAGPQVDDGPVST